MEKEEKVPLLDKVHEYFEGNAKLLGYYSTIFFVIIQIIYVVVMFFGKKVNIWLIAAVFLIPLLLFILSKDFLEDKSYKRAAIMIQTSFVLFIVNIVSVVFAGIIVKTSQNSALYGLTKQFFFIGIIITVVGVLLSLRSSGVKKIKEDIKENNIWENLKKGKNDTEPGDVFIAYNTETDEPVYWYYEDRFVHMLILGPTGSGKTSQILTPLVNQDLQNREVGVTVIEPKGDWAEEVAVMAEYHGRGDETVYFNPIMRDCPSFNPLYGTEDDVIENMATTFNSFSDGSSAFFLNMNETLVRNSLRLLKRAKGNYATLLDFYRLIHNANGYADQLLNEFTKALGKGDMETMKENQDLVSWFREDYFSDNSKTYEHCSGLRSQVSKLISNQHLLRVLNPSDGKSDIDFDKHLEEGTVITISTAQGELRDLSRFLGYFIILQFQSAVFKRPGNKDTRRGHFLYIDEFQTYANKSFENMLTQGRSYRVASHLATQNIELIGANSGADAKSFINMVLTNARNLVIFPGGNVNDLRYFSELFGEERVIREDVGITRQKFNPLLGIRPLNYDSESIRQVEEIEKRFELGDIGERKFTEVVIRLIEHNNVGTPFVGKINFIDKEIKDYIDEGVVEIHRQIAEFHEELKEEEAEPLLPQYASTEGEKKEKPTPSDEAVTKNDFKKKKSPTAAPTAAPTTNTAGDEALDDLEFDFDMDDLVDDNLESYFDDDEIPMESFFGEDEVASGENPSHTDTDSMNEGFHQTMLDNMDFHDDDLI